jgi:hypothetical protein
MTEKARAVEGLTTLGLRQFTFSIIERVLVFQKSTAGEMNGRKQEIEGGKKSGRRFDDNIGKELQDKFS